MRRADDEARDWIALMNGNNWTRDLAEKSLGHYTHRARIEALQAAVAAAGAAGASDEVIRAIQYEGYKLA